MTINLTQLLEIFILCDNVELKFIVVFLIYRRFLLLKWYITFLSVFMVNKRFL